MDKTLRTIAVQLAALLFFVMALTGWLYGHAPGVCVRRAFIGAAAIYLVVRVAGNLAVRILVEAMAQDHIRRRQKNNTRNE